VVGEMARLIGEKIFYNVPVWAVAFDENGNKKGIIKQYFQHYIRYLDNNTAEEINNTETDIIGKVKAIFNAKTVEISYRDVPERITNRYDFMNAKW
jgi:hypothetical protein